MVKVSVIVPVYNVKDYLAKCVDSLLNQDFDTYEILLIDDGSTDGSQTLCDSFRDEKIRVFHKENGGLADSRNYGLNYAKGEYVTFVDSDDFVSTTYLRTLYSAAQKEKADLVISRLRDFYEYSEIREEPICLDTQVLNRSQCYQNMLLQRKMDVNATAKLYKKSLFTSVRFKKGILYEDINMVDQIIEQCESIVALDYLGYYYLQRSGSIMYGTMSEKRLILLTAVEHLLALMKEKYPENVPAAIRRYVYCNFHLLGRSILDETFHDTSVRLRKNILQYRRRIFKESIYSKKEKIATLILSLGLPAFQTFWKVYKR